MAARKGRVLPLLAMAATLLYTAPFSKSLGGERCSLLPHGRFWIASQRVVALGRVGPDAVRVKEGLINPIAIRDYRSFVRRGDAVIMPSLIDVCTKILAQSPADEIAWRQ